MILYVQMVSLALNFNLYDGRQLAIYLSWTPFLLAPYWVTRSRVAYRIAVAIFFIDGFLNLCHLLILKGPITASSLFVLLNTNINEAREFMQLKFSWIWLLLFPYLFFFVIALRNPNLTDVLAKRRRIVIGIALAFSIVFLSENLIGGRLVRKGVPQTVKALVSFQKEMQTYKNMKQRKVMEIPASLSNKTAGQRIFLLIIGESCNRNHMSLHGYHRGTNPRLEKREDIIAYSNVVSSHSNTLNSVLSALTESNLDNKLNFDKSISIIDVFHSIGFKTIWLSNQSPIGLWDNAIYNLAQTSDIPVFVNLKSNTSFESTYLSAYDERLFEYLHSTLEKDEGDKLIAVHLMGSHSSYAKRYPKEFNRFKQSLTGRERLINEYDNSILYNDFVVDSLLNILACYSSGRDDLIASAIYFSDHGENVYDENDNVGHDYAGSLPKANVEIPFIVWLSDSYRQLYPKKYAIICANRAAPFVSDDLFHAIIDMNRIECDSYLENRSVFNENYEATRVRTLEDNEDYDTKQREGMKPKCGPKNGFREVFFKRENYFL